MSIYPTSKVTHVSVAGLEIQRAQLDFIYDLEGDIQDYAGYTGDTANEGGNLTEQVLELRERFGAPPLALNTVTTDSTAGARTWTAAELLGGLLLRDPNGAARTDVLPTAALVVAALAHPAVGQVYPFVLRNAADADETVTLGAGTGGTLAATFTIAQGETRAFLLRLTNVGAGTEAYTVYAEVALRVPVQDIRDTGGAQRLIPNATAKTIVDGSATSLFEVAVAAADAAAGVVHFSVFASDGTNHQALTGTATYAAVNKAGTCTCTITYTTAPEAKAVSSGTLTLAFTLTDDTNKVTVKLQPTGSLTETTYTVIYTVLPLRGVVTIL